MHIFQSSVCSSLRCCLFQFSGAPRTFREGPSSGEGRACVRSSSVLLWPPRDCASGTAPGRLTMVLENPAPQEMLPLHFTPYNVESSQPVFCWFLLSVLCINVLTHLFSSSFRNYQINVICICSCPLGYQWEGAGMVMFPFHDFTDIIRPSTTSSIATSC